MNILIIEDDYDFACTLKEDILNFISAYVPRSEFHICNDNYIEECKRINCDIAFIDIQLNGKDLGVTLAKEISLNNEMTPIVFVTNRDNLMHDTFTVQPFYYIRKSNYQEDFLVFCSLYENSLKSNNYITLSYDHSKTAVLISNICYAEIYDQSLYVHTSQMVYRDTRSLKAFLKDLKNEQYFIQIHKSYAVHLKYVHAHNKGKVILLNGLEIKIGRGFVKNFEKKYREYLLE